MAVIDLKIDHRKTAFFIYFFVKTSTGEESAIPRSKKKKSYLYQKPSCQDNQVKAKLPSFLACRALGIQ